MDNKYQYYNKAQAQYTNLLGSKNPDRIKNVDFFNKLYDSKNSGFRNKTTNAKKIYEILKSTSPNTITTEQKKEINKLYRELKNLPTRNENKLYGDKVNLRKSNQFKEQTNEHIKKKLNKYDRKKLINVLKKDEEEKKKNEEKSYKNELGLKKYYLKILIDNWFGLMLIPKFFDNAKFYMEQFFRYIIRFLNYIVCPGPRPEWTKRKNGLLGTPINPLVDKWPEFKRNGKYDPALKDSEYINKRFYNTKFDKFDEGDRNNICAGRLLIWGTFFLFFLLCSIYISLGALIGMATTLLSLLMMGSFMRKIDRTMEFCNKKLTGNPQNIDGIDTVEQNSWTNQFSSTTKNYSSKSSNKFSVSNKLLQPTRSIFGLNKLSINQKKQQAEQGVDSIASTHNSDLESNKEYTKGNLKWKYEYDNKMKRFKKEIISDKAEGGALAASTLGRLTPPESRRSEYEEVITQKKAKSILSNSFITIIKKILLFIPCLAENLVFEPLKQLFIFLGIFSADTEDLKSSDKKYPACEFKVGIPCIYQYKLTSPKEVKPVLLFWKKYYNLVFGFVIFINMIITIIFAFSYKVYKNNKNN